MTETDEAKPRMDAFRQNPDGLNGLDLLRRLMEIGTRPPIGDTLDFLLTEVRPGVAVFEGSPDRSVYNPLGSVHGGYAATLLDSAAVAPSILAFRRRRDIRRWNSRSLTIAHSTRRAALSASKGEFCQSGVAPRSLRQL